MRFSCASLLLAATAVATAQNTRPERPVYRELGAFFPNYRGADFGQEVGLAAGLGYTFRAEKGLALSGELRAGFQFIPQAGGGSGFGDDSLGSLTVSSISLAARYRPVGNRFFGGLGIGIGQGGREDGPNRSGLVLAFEGGVDLGPRTYVSLRYQHGDSPLLRGATLSLGFRF